MQIKWTTSSRLQFILKLQKDVHVYHPPTCSDDEQCDFSLCCEVHALGAEDFSVPTPTVAYPSIR